MTLFIVTILFLTIDYYVFQAIVRVSKEWLPLWKNILRYGFWIPTVLSIAAIMWWTFGDPYASGTGFRNWVLTGLVSVYFSKLFAVVVLFIDDIYRGIKWLANFFYKGADGNTSGEGITRSEFLSKTALMAAAIPFGTMAYGIISGAHDYRVRRKTVYLPNLPSAFDGITIGQLSDIHSGSFFSKKAVVGGIEMFMKEKPDVVFFTGDLVNNETSEVKEYTDIFNKVKAPLGVFSVTGNHDYGEYKSWSSAAAKGKNFADLIAVHKQMGYDLLMNENRSIEINGERIAILGIENWGAGRFPKYGKMDIAHAGTEEAPVKLLLSHDPSHWGEQVRRDYKDIDIMFAGHTHGFQFGVEVGDFKWSPSQYAYKQWAGLYQEDNQYLYVNRGFGFIGYPGRIGMPPELTMITLKRGTA